MLSEGKKQHAPVCVLTSKLFRGYREARANAQSPSMACLK